MGALLYYLVAQYALQVVHIRSCAAAVTAKAPGLAHTAALAIQTVTHAQTRLAVAALIRLHHGEVGSGRCCAGGATVDEGRSLQFKERACLEQDGSWLEFLPPGTGFPSLSE